MIAAKAFKFVDICKHIYSCILFFWNIEINSVFTAIKSISTAISSVSTAINSAMCLHHSDSLCNNLYIKYTSTSIVNKSLSNTCVLGSAPPLFFILQVRCTQILLPLYYLFKSCSHMKSPSIEKLFSDQIVYFLVMPDWNKYTHTSRSWECWFGPPVFVCCSLIYREKFGVGNMILYYSSPIRNPIFYPQMVMKRVSESETFLAQ